MGEMVEFKSNGGTCTGYLAGDSGPGVVVIQEWWGLNDHIKDIADRFAIAGYTALAPDLYHGEVTTEPDSAGKLLMSMNLATAAKDLSGAIDLLQQRTGRTKVGVTGFCMGGGLTLMVACQRPDAVAAAAPFYGGMRPDTPIKQWWKVITPSTIAARQRQRPLGRQRQTCVRWERLQRSTCTPEHITRSSTTLVTRCTTPKHRRPRGLVLLLSSRPICRQPQVLSN